VAHLAGIHDETPTARTLLLDVPDWPGHLGGQHVDVRLTAPDGYTTERSYSIGNASERRREPMQRSGVGELAAGSWRIGTRVELTVQRIADGEVSPYLTQILAVGDPLELRGPVGGWFVWRPQRPAPVLLIAGGSGIVPLMAMIRTRQAVGSRVPFRLLYGVRTPDDVFFADELRRRARDDGGLDVSYVYSRVAPEGWPRKPGRIGLADVNTYGWPPEFEPDCFVCGPTGFVEAVADMLIALGHDARRIKTERFG
jgi:ferredoxin-NADP reductase